MTRQGNLQVSWAQKPLMIKNESTNNSLNKNPTISLTRAPFSYKLRKKI